MKKIFVMGTSGSGKSTLAKYLARELGLVHIELDSHQWLPNWKKRTSQEIRERVAQEKASASGGFVVDGNFSKAEVDIDPDSVVVILDLPRTFVFQRILSRSIRRVITKEELWAGNREQARFLFSLNPEINPVLWSWKSHPKRRAAFRKMSQELGDSVKIYFVNNSQDLKELKKAFTG